MNTMHKFWSRRTVRGRSTNWRFLSSISGVSGTLEKISTLWTDAANSWTSLVLEAIFKLHRENSTFVGGFLINLRRDYDI